MARGSEERKDTSPKEKAKPFYREDGFDLLLNMQEVLAKGKGPGYELWAKKYNVKNVMKALLFFQEQGLRTYNELEKSKGKPFFLLLIPSFAISANQDSLNKRRDITYGKK